MILVAKTKEKRHDKLIAEHEKQQLDRIRVGAFTTYGSRVFPNFPLFAALAGDETAENWFTSATSKAENLTPFDVSLGGSSPKKIVKNYPNRRTNTNPKN